MAKKPTAFEELARKLIQVPRKEIDREAKKYKAKRKKRTK
jgi:hypothetical protein